MRAGRDSRTPMESPGQLLQPTRLLTSPAHSVAPKGTPRQSLSLAGVPPRGRDAFTMIARSPVSPGEQIYISYGRKKDNDALLMYYGFVERDSPAQRAMVPLEDANIATLRLGRSGPVDDDDGNVSAQQCQDACRRALEALPTTLEHDAQLLESHLSAEGEGEGGGGVLPVRQRLALEWRLERKKLLAALARGGS